MTAVIRIRSMTEADIEPCVGIHMKAFPGFFLSQLGPAFLREFYLAFVRDPAAVGLVAHSGGEIVGSVVGHTAPHGFFRQLLVRRWYAFALASLRLAVARPRTIQRLLRALRYRGATPFEMSGALLSSICVSPGVQGAGAGQLMLQSWLDEVRRVGVDTAYLTTDAISNDRVNEFYAASGWTLVGHFETPEGREMNCYTFALRENSL